MTWSWPPGPGARPGSETASWSRTRGRSRWLADAEHGEASRRPHAPAGLVGVGLAPPSPSAGLGGVEDGHHLVAVVGRVDLQRLVGVDVVVVAVGVAATGAPSDVPLPTAGAAREAAADPDRRGAVAARAVQAVVGGG